MFDLLAVTITWSGFFTAFLGALCALAIYGIVTWRLPR
jgi:hypothetical protein